MPVRALWDWSHGGGGREEGLILNVSMPVRALWDWSLKWATKTRVERVAPSFNAREGFMGLVTADIGGQIKTEALGFNAREGFMGLVTRLGGGEAMLS